MDPRPANAFGLPPLGAVLAGGAATRLGGDKAGRWLRGRPLISYPLGALSEAEILSVVVAKKDTALPPFSVPVVVEPDEPRHPLMGVVAALKHAGERPALVVPCDAPFLSPTLLRSLAGAGSATAVRSGGRLHPLIAIYPPSARDTLESAVRDGASATEALESLDPEYIEAPEEEAFNVNTPDDLRRAEEILTRPRS